MFDLRRRFSFGVDLDDYWTYSGGTPPKSIVVPHLLSLASSKQRTEARNACDALARMLSEARIDYARCWFPWNLFEPIAHPVDTLNNLLETSYAEWPIDNLVNTFREHEIGLVPVIACGYRRMLPRGLSPGSNPGLYVKRASIHARLLVRKYMNQIMFWQIENEPNWWLRHVAAGWRSGLSWVYPRGFRDQLLRALNNAVHAESPSATTIINLEADSRNLPSGAFTQSCDLIGLDFFPNYRAASPVNTSGFGIADQVARQSEKPVVILETGYPSGPSYLGYSAAKQVQYVTTACKHAYRLEKVNGIGIWRYSDNCWRSFPPQENSFGLIDREGNLKPAWTAYLETIRDLK